jgi:hypothetical protein
MDGPTEQTYLEAPQQRVRRSRASEAQRVSPLCAGAVVLARTVSDRPIKASASSVAMPISRKFYEMTRIFAVRLRAMFDRAAAAAVIADLDEYERLMLEHGGRRLAGARVVEIGYGARPLRLFAMLAYGADVMGIDLDAPLVAGSPHEVLEMYRKNGVERVLKSLIRFALFDLLERRFLSTALRNRGQRLRIERSRLLVGDAADLDLPADSLDLVYSEDVFEHMTENSIRRLLPKLAAGLGRRGIALIRPNIFTGITGGHLTDWFSPREVEANRPRRSEPWEHLRKQRFSATGFLNGLTRAQYRELFNEHFEILEEKVRYPGLGNRYLTPALRQELAHFDEEELFSNQVQFVLRSRVAGAPDRL